MPQRVSLRKKPNKVRVYSGATEDVSGGRTVSGHGREHQYLL